MKQFIHSTSPQLVSELRSLLAGQPSEARWESLIALVDSLDYSDEDLRPLFATLESRLASWPVELRLCPRTWIESLVAGDGCHPYQLCRTLRLHLYPDSGHHLREIFSSPNLRVFSKIDLSYCAFDDQARPFAAMSNSLYISQVTEIQLYSEQLFAQDIDDFSRLPCLHGLKRLRLSYLKMTDELIARFACEVKMPELKHLEFLRNDLSPDGFDAFLGASFFATVTSVDLSGSLTQLNFPGDFPSTDRAPCLESITCGQLITDSNAHGFAERAFACMPSLKHVRLGFYQGTQISDFEALFELSVRGKISFSGNIPAEHALWWLENRDLEADYLPIFIAGVREESGPLLTPRMLGKLMPHLGQIIDLVHEGERSLSGARAILRAFARHPQILSALSHQHSAHFAKRIADFLCESPEFSWPGCCEFLSQLPLPLEAQRDNFLRLLDVRDQQLVSEVICTLLLDRTSDEMLINRCDELVVDPLAREMDSSPDGRSWLRLSLRWRAYRATEDNDEARLNQLVEFGVRHDNTVYDALKLLEEHVGSPHEQTWAMVVDCAFGEARDDTERNSQRLCLQYFRRTHEQQTPEIVALTCLKSILGYRRDMEGTAFVRAMLEDPLAPIWRRLESFYFEQSPEFYEFEPQLRTCSAKRLVLLLASRQFEPQYFADRGLELLNQVQEIDNVMSTVIRERLRSGDSAKRHSINVIITDAYSANDVDRIRALADIMLRGTTSRVRRDFIKGYRAYLMTRR